MLLNYFQCCLPGDDLSISDFNITESIIDFNVTPYYANITLEGTVQLGGIPPEHVTAKLYWSLDDVWDEWDEEYGETTFSSFNFGIYINTFPA